MSIRFIITFINTRQLKIVFLKIIIQFSFCDNGRFNFYRGLVPIIYKLILFFIRTK